MNEVPEPFLTVAIPVFDGEAVLAPMLASLDAQDWSLFEVLFGDDGSTDGTPRVLEAFAAKHPGRVFVDRHENVGPGPTRNRLLARARGKYVWFCDADDELAPGCIAAIAGILSSRPSPVLSFSYGDPPAESAVPPFGSGPVALDRTRLLLSIPAATVAKVFRTDLLRENGIEFPDLRIGEDFVFTMRAALCADSGLHWFERPYWVRRRPDSVSGRIDDAFCRSALESAALVRNLAAAHPADRMEIGVQEYLFLAYLRQRVEDEAPPDVAERWLPAVKARMKELVDARDNPLLRFSNSVYRQFWQARRGARLAERLREKADALRGKVLALKAQRAQMEGSISWRLTAPLRLPGRLLGLLRR
ncbi:MAG: glycosyltransferase family 2 protein [Kiritimatiellae bacterium]|nr:glycosyltransferase family 2 protein [Kiritimatiellia bacterium]